ncbi:MAG: MbnP family protein [Bacteroidia bacterium]
MRFLFLTFLCLNIAFTACKKDDPDPPIAQTGNINLKIEYYFDAQPLTFITKNYTVAAGYETSFSRFEYYISGLKFYRSDSAFHAYNIPVYADAQNYTSGILLKDIPAGKYFSTKLYIGLDAEHNKSNSLPNTPENINMEWPDAMGGGYHFLKLEGQFKDSSGTNGFAMHLGRSENLVNHQRFENSFEIKAGETTTVILKMNVAEWFKNPALYDFNKDGLYSMSNMVAMKKISQNGADVFTK